MRERIGFVRGDERTTRLRGRRSANGAAVVNVKTSFGASGLSRASLGVSLERLAIRDGKARACSRSLSADASDRPIEEEEYRKR
jgi:hypothetical protein